MKLYSRVLGKGQPLLIIHGLFGMSDNWQSLVKLYADYFEVHLIDQRNHGCPHMMNFLICTYLMTYINTSLIIN